MAAAQEESELEIVMPHVSQEPRADLAEALTLLTEVSRGTRGVIVRIYRPRATMAFGQRDRYLPGFEAAWDAAKAHGFTPVVRKAGGRAMPYHNGCLIVDCVAPHPFPLAQTRRRFEHFGELYVRILRSLGVDAHLGQVPGEYCPGEFSVYGRFSGSSQRVGECVKLVGTAQRVIRNAWLFSSAIVVDNPKPLRAVLSACYAELGLEWDPSTVGAIHDLVPTLPKGALQENIVEAHRNMAPIFQRLSL